MDDISWDGLTVSPSNLPLFMKFLENQRSRLSVEEWKRFVDTDPKLKEWRYFLLNDPYTRWGYVKPRGYPGDAVLMDFAYKHDSVRPFVSESSAEGKHIYEHTSNAQQSLSAVSRTIFISNLLKRELGKKSLSIASIASGHGREYDLLPKSALRNIDNVLAVDSDKQSLNEFQKMALAKTDVTTVDKNVFRTRLQSYGRRDVVYSLGLFDYLNTESASKVLENMCSCVSPGGCIVVANLHHQAANLGYCEAVMNWWMVSRSEEDLKKLTRDVENLKSTWSVGIERLDCFCYLIIRADTP